MRGASGSPLASRPVVVIIGGGFAGLNAARGLARVPVRVVLVDQRNHHLFQPLLYQVASAALNPSDIASPLRRVLSRQRNAEVMMERVRAIDLRSRKLTLEDRDLDYDYLVLAAGAVDSYFGHDEWAPNAPGLKSAEQALDIRNRLLCAFEAADRATDERERRAHLTFAVVGAGPTGVELAGAFAEIATRTLETDFRHLRAQDVRVVLIEGAPRVLPTFPEPLSRSAARQLSRLGVEILTGHFLTHIDAHGVTVKAVDVGSGGVPAERRLESRTVVWAAGVRASPLAATLGLPLDRGGRVLVEPDLSLPGFPEAFAVGDIASLTIDGKAVPGLAPAAIQEGRAVAHNIAATLRGVPRKRFRYIDKGTLATIGRARAVGQIGPIRLSGLVAWLAWCLVHIVYLIGFRNRYLVMTQWAWLYFTSDRGARVIVGNDGEPSKPIS
jgi:NADH:ubiquinone reductase (H+-translocating)